MSTSVHPVPPVPWSPAAQPAWMVERRRSAARALGAAVGLSVAIGSLVVLASLGVASGGAGAATRSIDELLWAAMPSLAAGTLGGWLLGPLAARTTTASGWVGTVLTLAFVTTVIGSFLTGLVIALESTATADPAALAEAVGRGMVLGLLGLFVVGWLIGPLLLIPATAWAIGMRFVLRHT